MFDFGINLKRMVSKARQGLFYVIDSFTIKRRQEVYLIGTLKEGDLKEGWFINIPLNNSIAISWRISQIEDIEMANKGGDYKLLIVGNKDPEYLEFLFALNVGSELLDITIEGED